MKMKILQAGETVLRKKAQALSRDEIRSKETQQLIEWMRETMHAAPGVGLAAPQVGISQQIAVIEDRAEYQRDVPPEVLQDRERKPVPFHVIVNPAITLEPGEAVAFFEGCLSVAGATAVVPRASMARVQCLDHRGEECSIKASGWYARILQHEIDHLQGMLYLDRMYSRTFATLENFNRLWKAAPKQAWLALLNLQE